MGTNLHAVKIGSYNKEHKARENIFYVWRSFFLRLSKGFEPIKPYSIGASLKQKQRE